MIQGLGQHLLNISAVELLIIQHLKHVRIGGVLFEIIHDFQDTAQGGDLLKLFRRKELRLHRADLCYDPAVFQ